MIQELQKEENERLQVQRSGENIKCMLFNNQKQCKCKDCMKTIELKVTDKYYNKIAGYNNLENEQERNQIQRDQFGNLLGAGYDLCPDNAFKGETIAVLHFYTRMGFDFNLPKSALMKKGFELCIWRDGPPGIQEFKTVLKKACQLWLISNSSILLNSDFLNEIKKFFEEGKG